MCKLQKQRYRNPSDALAAAATLLSRGVMSKDLRTYPCKTCNCWHLCTAKVQLHPWALIPIWRCPRVIRTWFKQREVPLTGDIFVDIGFAPAEAARLHARVDLLSQIVKAAKPYTQAQLAVLLDEPADQIAKLLRGKVSVFGLPRLKRYAARLDSQTSQS